MDGMASAQAEAEVFAAFTAQLPNFTGAAVTCSPGPNPPDFICTDAAGDRIGVELSEWLDEEQIARERPQYRRERQFLTAISSREVTPPQNVGHVCLFETEGVWLKNADAAEFRSQLYAFINDLDAKWHTLEDHDDPQGADIHDFTGYPQLQKYLIAITCRSHKWFHTSEGSEWIVFMNHGGAYTPDTAVEALEQTLAKKTAKYQNLLADANLSKLYLLIYYDQGFHYNSPFDAPDYGFNEIAAHLSTVAQDNHGVFDGIFLFIPAKKQLAQVL